MIPGIDAGACLLLALSGSVKGTTVGWVEDLSLTLSHREGCDHVDLQMPADVELTALSGRTIAARGPGAPIDPTRVVRGPVRADGARVYRVVLADLSDGDQAELRFTRTWTDNVDYQWEPPPQLQFVELKTPRALPHAHAGLRDDGPWVYTSDPGPTVWLTVPHVWASGESPTPPRAAELGLSVAQAAARLEGLAFIPHAFDGRQPVVGDAALARGAADDRGYARTLIALTTRGPDDVGLGRWARMPELPATTGGPEVAVVRTADGPVLLPHPDQVLPPGAIHTPWGTLDVEGVPVGLPSADPVDAEPPHTLTGPPATWRATVEVRLSERNPLAALGGRHPGTVSVTWQASWADATTARALTIPVPDGATHPQGEVASPGTLRASAAALHLVVPPGVAEARVGWELPLADAWGALAWDADAPPRGRVVPVDRSGEPVAVADGWSMAFDDARGWRLTRLDGHEVLTSRDRLLAELVARVFSASLPEPGTPPRVRQDAEGWALAAMLPDLLALRAVPAPLPRVGTATVRPLVKARRTGLVTPMEAAALISHYAMQGRLGARWALVQPGPGSRWRGVVPRTLTEALVRFEHDGEIRWLDPLCHACAAFELRPELLDAPAFGPDVPSRTPSPRLTDPPVGDRGLWLLHAAPPEHTARWVVDVSDRVTATLEGVAALQLRRHLEAVAPEARAPGLRALLGATEGLEHDGLDERGAAVKLSAAQAGEVHDPLDLEGGREALALPHGPGVRAFSRPFDLPGDRVARCDGQGWSWRGVVQQDRAAEQLLVREVTLDEAALAEIATCRDALVAPPLPPQAPEAPELPEPVAP